MEHEGRRLHYLTEVSNRKETVEVDKQLFINQSISQILRSISQTIIDIINEFVAGEAKDFRSAVTTLFRGNRMIYIGIVVVLVGFLLYILDLGG